MNEGTSQFDDIVVKIVPTRFKGAQHEGADESPTQSAEVKRSYNALVYTNVDGIPFAFDPNGPPSGQASTVANLSFAGKERITVRWSEYNEYLAAFLEGEKAPHYMRERLLEVLSPGLEALFGGLPPRQQPVRVWWAPQTPELDDLPWELLAHGYQATPPDQFFFVRGLPPEAKVPILPTGGRLRLAVIHHPQFAPYWLLQALDGLHGSLDVEHFVEPPLEALERVAREGYELLHIVADGVTSLAYDGILYFHGFSGTRSTTPTQDTSGPQISPGELSAVLRSSRVTVLGLTGQESSNPDGMQIAGQQVPSVYRAFAYLGGSRLTLPSVVAPLGPLEPAHHADFWTGFYQGLAETFSIRQAMARGRANKRHIPIAVFLRHPHEVQFRRTAAGEAPPEVDPKHIGVALEFSQDLVDRLRAHGELYGSLPEAVSQFIVSEGQRQEDLSAELDPWLGTEDESR